MSNCKCGCGESLDNAEAQYRAEGYLNAAHKARLDEVLKQVEEKYVEEDLRNDWNIEEGIIRILITSIQERLSGHYWLESALGVGSTSIVLRVLDKRLNSTPRAMKVARPRLGKAGSILAVFEQEVNVLLSINHENIVKLYYKGEVSIGDAVYPYFVLEFIENLTRLDKWLLGPDATAGYFLQILRQVVRALAYLEEHDIVHCDVKPANIVVGTGGRARLTDLGYAKVVRRGDDAPTGVAFTEEFAHPKLLEAVQDKTDRLANIARIERSKILPVFDRFAFGKTLLKLLSMKAAALVRLSAYERRYVTLIALRLLDCDHSQVGPIPLDARTLAEVSYRTTAEAEHDVARLTNEVGVEEEAEELSPYVAQTVQLPVVGRVPFTRRVENILKHPVFARLGRVSQLGLLDLIYPGATHSRLEHSLGTFANACLYIRALYYDPINPLFRSIMRKEDILAGMLAALLHDLGQYPLAHDLEEADYEMFDHSQWTKRLLAERGDSAESLGAVIEDAFGREVSTDGLLEVLERKGSGFRARILRSIIDGPIDADKLDYVQRDSHHLGLPFGSAVDRDRLLACLTVAYRENKDDRTVDVSVGITEKGRVAAEALAFGRYAVFTAAYWHHTSRAIKAMLHWIVWDVIERAEKERGRVEGLREELYEKFVRKVSEVAEQLELFRSQRFGGGSPRVDPADAGILRWLHDRGSEEAKHLTRLLLARTFYKRVFTLGAQEEPTKVFADSIVLSVGEIRVAGKRLEAMAREELARQGVEISEAKYPVVLLDIPRKRMPDLPLYYVEERTHEVERLWTSPVWAQLYERFIETAGRVRVFCHPKWKGHIEAIERATVKRWLGEAVDEVQRLRAVLLKRNDRKAL